MDPIHISIYVNGAVLIFLIKMTWTLSGWKKGIEDGIKELTKLVADMEKRVYRLENYHINTKQGPN